MVHPFHIARGVCIALFLACTATTALSQTFPDSKGREFWFSFLPNLHNNHDSLAFNPELKLQHEVYIYVGADVPTKGTITLTDRLGVKRVETFNITDPTVIYEFHTFFQQYELVGYCRGTIIDYSNMQTESVAKQSVHIVADNDVTVYALNQASLTSDAFLVLPQDALAEDYIVSSYYSDVDWALSGVPIGSPTPSQFCVVATADKTVVDIYPSAPTFLSPNLEPQQIVLNAGEVYLVQADPRIQMRSDLTGTVVRASKPVAVFGGHQRALIPLEEKGKLSSRDCLIEQMNPIRTWGKSAYIFPLALGSTEDPVGESKFRVVAGFDSTNVAVGGATVATLGRGEFYEGNLTSAQEVTSSKPVLVSMLKKTSGGGNTTRVGDPFMMLVPPAEQFMNSYRFVNIQAYQYFTKPFSNDVVKGPPVYVEQYLTVVIPTVALSSLTLDGVQVDATGFAPIPGTTYSWKNFSMTDGIHSILADTTFGIYVYGYGEANSYGYIGGMAFRPLDVQPPVLTGTSICGVFKGTATDSVIGDTRIFTARILPSSEKNTTATLAPFTPPERVVQVSATLINPYDDGEFAVEATDNVKQTTSTVFSVPGFTIGAVGQGATGALQQQRSIIAQYHQRCDTVVIENYGKFPHTIRNVRTSSGTKVSTTNLPTTLQPGESMAIVVCHQYDSAGMQVDTLFVDDTCTSRPVFEYIADVRADQEPPYTSLSAKPCSTEHFATVGDDREFDYGLLNSTINTAVITNCTVTLVDQNAYRAQYKVVVTDPLFDAVYGFIATDSAGNTASYIDTIPGFTLSIDNGGGYFQQDTLPQATVGTMVCDTIWLGNYGAFTQVVSAVRVHRNVTFSIPQSQLPIVVAPGERKPLLVCYEPSLVDGIADIDTLDFVDSCLVKALEVQGNSAHAEYTGLSRCDVRILTSQYATGHGLVVAPNPATGSVNLLLDQEVSTITVRVATVQGTEALRKSWSGTATNTFTLDVTPLPAGTYVVTVQTEHFLKSSVLSIR